MTILQTCPACGEGNLTPQVETNTVTANGKSYEIPTHFAVCNMCESEVADYDDTRQNKMSMNEVRLAIQNDLEQAIKAKQNNE